MKVYFSHSYRDRAINGPFLEQFVEEEISLVADQKSDVWCVAKLERYMRETTGFVSIIPRRASELDPGSYSPYIGYELNLARRARVPRLLLVDQEVLKYHPLDFPEDAVAFHPNSLESERARHIDAIRTFSRALETARESKVGSTGSRQATVVTSGNRYLRDVAQDVAEVLRRHEFVPTVIAGKRPAMGLDDIRLIETLRRSELCAFLLGERISETHVALAMAHADFIPSLRLQYVANLDDSVSGISGLIRWNNAEDLLVQLTQQLESYANGLVSPVELALAAGAADAVADLGTMRYRQLPENRWDINDGPSLVRHVHVEHGFVRDEVSRVRAELNTALGRIDDREGCLEVARKLYDNMRRHNFAYEFEQRSGTPGVQIIRTPRQIQAHCTATCIDASCLFAALLEAAGQEPLLVVLEGSGYAHALAGYRARGEPRWEHGGLADLLGAVARRDAVLFETTGAFSADAAVGAESPTARVDNMLPFSDAIAAAEEMLRRPEMKLRHFVDVRDTRPRLIQTS